MTGGVTGGSGWTGRLFLGPWWLVYVGEVGPTESHAHHALQVILAPGVRVVDERGERASPAAVEPDRAHALIGTGRGALVFVDPEATGAPRALAGPLPSRPGDLPAPATFEGAEQLVAAVTRAEPFDRAARHPAVATVLGLLADDPAARLDDLAARVGLSGSRLTHLFTEQVGIPLRAYRRWVKLLLAAETLSRGASLNDAAHEAGFADAAHLHRTFRAQFGLRPGGLFGAVAWVTR